MENSKETRGNWCGKKILHHCMINNIIIHKASVLITPAQLTAL